MKMQYTVYIQGFNQVGEDETINDYEDELATFWDKEQAIWFATHCPFSIPLLTPHAKVIVEERYEDGSYNDLILEKEIS